MAFTGTATIVQVTDKRLRITGLSLAGGATGTIGLFGNSGTPGVRLPETFQPAPYDYNGATVTLADSVKCEAIPAATTSDFEPVGVTKSGTTDADFLITLGNGFASVTPGLEIYIEFHG